MDQDCNGNSMARKKGKGGILKNTAKIKGHVRDGNKT